VIIEADQESAGEMVLRIIDSESNGWRSWESKQKVKN